MRANLIAALIGTLCVAGCGGSLGSASGNGSGGGGGTTPTGSNVQPVTVDSGPSVVASSNTPAVNTLYTSVTICSPGTTNCQTIDHMQVDTGSSGVRILASALTLTLPQEKDSAGNGIAECTRFVDGSSWGSVRLADIKVAGEVASNQAVQVIGDATYTTPTTCKGNEDSVTTFGANGILGVGPFIQDCGSGCTTPGNGNYFSCTSNTACSDSGLVLLNQQVSNPVAAFATDNNGIMIQMPSVSGTAASVSGSLIFGIGTEGNNSIGSAKVFTLDDTGALTTDYNGSTLTGSFIDSGSNGYFFNDSSIKPCITNTGFYCPNPTLNLTGTIVGFNGAATATVNFTVVDADTLFNNATTTIAAVAGLAGSASSVNTSSGSTPLTGFDWGLPFYFGRTVYTAIESQNTSAGAGPYFAF